MGQAELNRTLTKDFQTSQLKMSNSEGLKSLKLRPCRVSHGVVARNSDEMRVTKPSFLRVCAGVWLLTRIGGADRLIVLVGKAFSNQGYRATTRVFQKIAYI